MGETVQALTGQEDGVWLVTTQGSQHIWDLDTSTYVRLPGSESTGGAMALDGVPCRICRVGAWPAVGACSFVWFDEGESAPLEHWRQSSTIKSIERIGPRDVVRLLTQTGDRTRSADGPTDEPEET